MNPHVILRQLTSAGIDQMRALNVLFGEAFGDPGTYTKAPPSDEYLSTVLAREHVIVLVALVTGSVVGGLVAYELEKLEQARREVYIYDLAVASEHRRQGIATALIDRLREIVANRGTHVIFVQADYGDEAAIALYESLGTREDVMHFDIAVS
jgi:aminoglycoside 3-N-acetyltransferase I